MVHGWEWNCSLQPMLKPQPRRPHRDPRPAQPAIEPHPSAPLAHPLLGQGLSSDVTSKYELERVLGRGAFGTTRVCVDRATGQRRACKSILKTRVEGLGQGGGDAIDVRRELDVMLHLAGGCGWVGVWVGCGRAGAWRTQGFPGPAGDTL